MPDSPVRQNVSQRFYAGAAHIERWLERPGVERFMDAATVWYLVVAVIFIVVCVGVLVVEAVS